MKRTQRPDIHDHMIVTKPAESQIDQFSKLLCLESFVRDISHILSYDSRKNQSNEYRKL